MRWSNLLSGCVATMLASFTLGQSLSSVTVAQSTTDERPAAVEVDSTNSNVVVAATKRNGGSTSDAQVIVFDSDGDHLQTFTYTPASPNDKWEQVVDMSMRGSSFALLIEQRDEYAATDQNFLLVKGHITSNVPSVDWAVSVTPGGSSGIFTGWQVKWTTNGAYIDICGDKYSSSDGIAAYARINATNNGTGQEAGTVAYHGVVTGCVGHGSDTGGNGRCAIGVVSDNSKLFLVANKKRNTSVPTVAVIRAGSSGVESTYLYEGDGGYYLASSFESSGLTIYAGGSRGTTGYGAPYLNLQASTTGDAASVNYSTIFGTGADGADFLFGDPAMKSFSLNIHFLHKVNSTNMFVAGTANSTAGTGWDPSQRRKSFFSSGGVSIQNIEHQSSETTNQPANANSFDYPRTGSANAGSLSMTLMHTSSSVINIIAYRTTHSRYTNTLDGEGPYATKLHTNDWNCFYAVTYNNSANSTKDVRLYKYTPSGSP